MTYPTPVLVNMLLACQKFFASYIERDIRETGRRINVPTLNCLFLSLVDELGIINSFNYCQKHHTHFEKNIIFCLTKFSKILLNNYTKKIMDLHNSSKPHLSKISKHDYEPQVDKFYQ